MWQTVPEVATGDWNGNTQSPTVMLLSPSCLIMTEEEEVMVGVLSEINTPSLKIPAQAEHVTYKNEMKAHIRDGETLYRCYHI